MAITFHPRPGQILLCDFSQGFKEPEMVKSHRPVVVLTPPIVGRAELVTVLALSTKKPGKRLYFMQKLGREQMKEIYSCALHGLNLGQLSQHL